MRRLVYIPNANGKAENLREGIWLTSKLEKPTVSHRRACRNHSVDIYFVKVAPWMLTYPHVRSASGLTFPRICLTYWVLESRLDTKGFFKRREWVIIPRSKIHFSIWIGYIGLSVLLASAPIVPVYAGKQSTPESAPTTGGSTPSINNPGQGGGGQGGTQNTPNPSQNPNQNTGTATPPQVVNQLAVNNLAAVGGGVAAVLGTAGLAALGLYAGVHTGRLSNPLKKPRTDFSGLKESRSKYLPTVEPRIAPKVL